MVYVLQEHEECDDNEGFLYCCICTKDPVFPATGRGAMKQGLIIDKYHYKDNSSKWKSTKIISNNHFHSSQSLVLSLDCNKERFDNLI